jgi:hypothetical protein
MLTQFPQEITTSKPTYRAHRPTRRSTGVCETCGTEFEQPRGPSSKFCPPCRKVARRQVAKAHMRLIRGGLAGAQHGRMVNPASDRGCTRSSVTAIGI